jgi:hypothetical protein
MPAGAAFERPTKNSEAKAGGCPPKRRVSDQLKMHDHPFMGDEGARAGFVGLGGDPVHEAGVEAVSPAPENSS